MGETFVKIGYDRFIEMYKAQDTLNKLESMGVDNWCGYDEIEWDEETVELRAEAEAITNLIK